MGYVQILDFETKHVKDVESLLSEWRRGTDGDRTVQHEIVARDNNRPEHYVAILQFSLRDAAQRNEKLAESDRFADRMAELCYGTVDFTYYEVIRD